MSQFTQRHYQALLRYLKDGLRTGALKNGSKLPSEAELASILSFSVPSLHEAMRLLELFGLVTQEADGCYRLSGDPSRSFSDLFELFLLMEQTSYQDVLRLRRSIELQAIPAICENITEAEKQSLYFCLVRMMTGAREDRLADREFHNVLVTASRDRLAADLNQTLVQFSSPSGVGDFQEYDSEQWNHMMQRHMQLYQAIVANQPEHAAEAVNAHFDYLEHLWSLDSSI